MKPPRHQSTLRWALELKWCIRVIMRQNCQPWYTTLFSHWMWALPGRTWYWLRLFESKVIPEGAGNWRFLTNRPYKSSRASPWKWIIECKSWHGTLPCLPIAQVSTPRWRNLHTLDHRSDKTSCTMARAFILYYNQEGHYFPLYTPTWAFISNLLLI